MSQQPQKSESAEPVAPGRVGGLPANAVDTLNAAPLERGGAPPPSPNTADSPTARRARRSVRYPNAYVWFVFLAALDIMLTYLILHPVLFSHDPFMTEPRGAETNALANWIIERWDVPGMVAFKFLLVVLVVVLCEIIGRHKEQTGRRIAEWAVAITAIPVILALIQMVFDLYFWFHPPH
jgi:hypothetical protein